MIVKIIVLISQPVRMELVLRKRIATTIGKTEGWWSGKAMKYLLGYVRIFSMNTNRKFELLIRMSRNHFDARVLFVRSFPVFRNIFTRLKIEKV